MTDFTFRERTQAFDMRTFVVGFASTDATENGGELSYITAGSPNDVELFGDNLLPTGLSEAPITGEIERLEIALGTSPSTIPDVVIETSPPISASLIPSGVAFGDNEMLWRAILQGQTTFHFEGGSTRIDVLGDFRTADSEVITRGNGFGQAGNDLFSGTGGDGSFPRGDGEFLVKGASVEGGHDQFVGAFDTSFGDVFGVVESTLFGGNDTYTETEQFTADPNVEFTGDAAAISGNSTSGKAIVFGGDDSFFGFAGSTSDYIFHGDVRDVSSATEITGGHDTFSVGGTGEAVAFGDAEAISGDAEVLGGDDYFAPEATQGFHGTAIFYGDAFSVTGTATLFGGDDTLIGGSGDDTIYGDVKDNANSAQIIAGNDSLVGGAGDDMLFGDVDQPNSLSPGLTGGDDTLNGGAGADVLNGGQGRDWAIYSGDAVSIDLFFNRASGGDAEGDEFISIENIRGTSGDDTLIGDLFSENELVGGAGDDSLMALGDADTLTGGSGRDTLVHSGMGSVYNGGNGFDTLIIQRNLGSTETLSSIEHGVLATTSFTVINSTHLLSFQSFDVSDAPSLSLILEARDFVSSEANIIGRSASFSLTISGSGANNSIIGSGFGEIIRGEAGNDTILGGSGDDQLFGENATVGLGTGDDIIHGGNGSDTLIGGAGHDSLSGDAGDDTLSAGNGDDMLRGEGGRDELSGGDGHDTLIGGKGLDTLKGGSGADDLRGNSGSDAIIGNGGDDTLEGNGGDDTLFGEGGNDHLTGGRSNDTLLGGNNNDTLEGGDQRDSLDGETGADVLLGGRGNDTMIGGAGHDTLNGQRGDDELTGDAGADVFLFRNNGGDDVITDFGNGADRLNIDDAVFGGGKFSAADVIAMFGTVTGTGIELDFRCGNSVTLNGFFDTSALESVLDIV
ncbi:MAG: calcium-binding protein [Pseudomonadota bacterium]